jgi:simple sugar transport system permease protein
VNPALPRVAGLRRWRLEKRRQPTWQTILLTNAAALGASLIVSAGLIATSGADVGQALQVLYTTAFKTWNGFSETLVQSTPLIFTGLAIVIAFRARVWNIGAEGQFFAGAMASTWLALALPGLPRPLLLALITLAAMIGGAAWALIPGLLRARLNTNEIFVTVMMNFIIVSLLSFLLDGIWQVPGEFYLQTPVTPEEAHYPRYFGSRVHLGFLLALVMAAGVYLLLWRTPLGYEFRAIGDNPLSAQYKGVAIGRTIVLVMALSGALAGLAGGSEIAGIHHRIRLDISLGYGFTGILIAMLGRLNPFGAVMAAIFFGALVNGSTAMQIFAGVPVAIVFSVQGIVLCCLIIAEALARYRLSRVADVG